MNVGSVERLPPRTTEAVPAMRHEQTFSNLSFYERLRPLCPTVCSELAEVGLQMPTRCFFSIKSPLAPHPLVISINIYFVIY